MEDKVIEKPEIIQEKINQLKKELKESQKHYEYEFICDDKFSDDMVGFFNLGKARKILKLLNDGFILQFRHGVYDNVDVYMNPQKNRILVSENKDINEDNIMKFIIWCAGEWYLYKPYSITGNIVAVDKVIEKASKFALGRIYTPKNCKTKNLKTS